MTHNDTQVGQLVLNLIEDKATFDTMSQSGLNANELYFISNDNTDPIVDVKYENNKFSYITDMGNTKDIITIANLKSALNLSSVSSDGLYTSLSSKPSINGVELNGNKTTSDLGISLNYTSDSITNKPSINNVTLIGNKTSKDLNINYGDINNLPIIPEITSEYVSGNTTKGLTAKGVESALGNYVSKTIEVTGTGALSGGGQLNRNISITHRSAPTGIQTSAIKVGVDQYGHVCVGAGITAEDINAIPLKYSINTSATSLDGTNSTLAVISSASETLGFSTLPKNGQLITLQYANISENSITVTIPTTLSNAVFINGTRISSNYTLQLNSNTSKRLDILLVSQDNVNYMFINII